MNETKIIKWLESEVIKWKVITVSVFLFGLAVIIITL